MNLSNIAAILLAAGASSRLGRPKQTVQLGGETLLERAIRIAMEAGLSPMIVVVRDADLVRTVEAMGATAQLHPNADEGMASSIAAGIRRAQCFNAFGAVLLTCDQVGLRSAHLRELCALPEAAAGSGYAGKVGIPAYFPAAEFPALLALTGDIGARKILRGARCIVDESLALDIDTEADLTRARALLEQH